MTTNQSAKLDFTNCALIQDETLLAICLVIEHGWPAGPTFLHALNTLIETVVIHEEVYFDPLQHLERTDGGSETVAAVLRTSEFVKALLREGAIRKFPNATILDEYFVAHKRDYSYTNFMVEAYWSIGSFAYGQPDGEADRLDLYLDLVSKAPLLLEPRGITPTMTMDIEDGRKAHIVEGDALVAAMLASSLSLNDRDMKLLEGLNFRSKAWLDLAVNTGLHLHPFYLALPHQIGAIRSSNSRAMELFHSIQDIVSSKDPSEREIGESAFMRAPIPGLTEVIFGRCKGSSSAILVELLKLRDAHHKFRNYLTTYEQKWNQAQTKKERWGLRRDFDDALKLVLDRDSRPSSRLIYTVWDLVKDPTKIPQAIGDKLVKRGREEHIIGRVKGLHDFWNDLASSPPADISRAQFNRMFSKRTNDRTWTLAQSLADSLNESLQAKSP